MQGQKRTTIRRGHWRNQRYGPGRSLIKRIYVQPVKVAVPPSSSRQLDMLDAMAGHGTNISGTRVRKTSANDDTGEAEIVRSYWRQQPYGPQRQYRRMTLIDVRKTGSR